MLLAARNVTAQRVVRSIAVSMSFGNFLMYASLSWSARWTRPAAA